jgi:hypothetical protein
VKFTLYFVLVLLVLSSCKNDLKLNAPYKEIPTIYAVLSPNEKVHRIRINKVFLGEGNANVMAKVADSVNYGPGEITVTMDRYDYYQYFSKDRKPTKSYAFTEQEVKTTEGAFSNFQRIYVNSDSAMDQSGVYKLNVKNNHTGAVFTATAIAFKNEARISGTGYWAPSLLFAPYYPFPPGTNPDWYIDYSSGSIPAQKKINYFPIDTTVKICQQVIRLHFYDSLYNYQKEYHYVDYASLNQYPKDASTVGGQKMLSRVFTYNDFFSNLGTALGKMNLSANVYGRKCDRIEYIVYFSTQQFLDYLQFSAPSQNISQQKPLYSNFENSAALGIFTFRSSFSVSKSISSSFIDHTANDPATCKYQFFSSQLKKTGCQ